MTTPASGSNETDPAPGAPRKRRSAGAGLRGDGPGGGLAPASSHLDGGSRSETSAARAVRDRSGARTPAVTASRTRSTVPARGQTSGSNLVAGSSCRTSSRRAASGCLSRADRPITPRTDQCSSAMVYDGNVVDAWRLGNRPEVGRGYPLNLSILLSGGKETNQDSISNGE